MDNEEKELYQLTDRWGEKALPIDWNKLPDEIIGEIPSDCFFNILSYSDKDGLNSKTVVYFRKVKKFRKGTQEYTRNNIIIGI